jgi:phosphatidylglycerophosphate synthase
MNASHWQLPAPPLRRSAVTANVAGLAAVVLLGWAAQVSFGLSDFYTLMAALAFEACMWLAFGYLHASHPFDRFGPANYVTTLRLGLVMLLAGFLFERASPAVWAATGAMGICALGLDGLDGWWARRSGMAGRFGARFDMETDALLILVLAALVWIADKAGPWVLLSGLLRYGFLAATWAFRWLQSPLPESWRRKAVCVVQVAALALALLPVVPRPASVVVVGIALGVLTWSFFVDVAWLRRHAYDQTQPAGTTSSSPGGPSWWSYAKLLVALVLLNACLTFENVWPTPGVRWGNTLSIEVAAALLILAAFERWRPKLPQARLRVLAGIWVVLVIGRYGDVTAPALYGRDVNLYWDLPHVSNVAEMLAQATPPWLVAAAGLGTLLGVVVLYVLLSWSFTRLSDAMTRRADRIVLASVAGLSLTAFAVAPTSENSSRVGFASPVTASYARHVGLAVQTLAARGTGTVTPGPPLDVDLGALDGADVLLLFVESYGATAWERDEYASPLGANREELAAAIRETSRGVVSAYVESPTFGGSSWLAHVSLMSGIEVRDAEQYALLLSETRDTLVTRFAREGYRTVAVMPGLWQSWPEGAFYGFDDIYGGSRLGYEGPPFGWWEIPDQFALAKLKTLELSTPARSPVFAFLPTVSTHAPFSPTPPYQPDWVRVLTDEPFDAGDVTRAWEQWVDWLNLGPAYVRSVAYAYTSIAGYLRESSDRDLVLILIGDHQPAAAVTGEGAPWDVPVHVVTTRQSILERLLGAGFDKGLAPRRPSLGPMHALLPVLLDAFGNRDVTAETTRAAQR